MHRLPSVQLRLLQRLRFLYRVRVHYDVVYDKNFYGGKGVVDGEGR